MNPDLLTAQVQAHIADLSSQSGPRPESARSPRRSGAPRRLRRPIGWLFVEIGLRIALR